MRNIIFFFLFLISYAFFSCQKKAKKPQTPEVKTITDSIIKKEKNITKSWDSLNRQNTKAFFIEYGKQNPETEVLLKTKFGNIKLRLYNDTPIHRASFIFLTKIGYFSTTVFHRIARDMAIQGGESDNITSANLRNKYENYVLPAEISPHRKHKYGTLAIAREMENNPNKDSNPFNFYIISDEYGVSHLDGEYTIFGEVISGSTAIKKISELETTSDEWPIVDVFITMDVIK